MTPRRRRAVSRIAAAVALAAALSAAGWARLAEAPRVLGQGELVPMDGDSAYHLRRILWAVERFPALPTVDRFMNWPDGAPCPWADGFDLLGAALARAAGGVGSRPRAELAGALLPVILGLLVVWATMDLARLGARRGPAARTRASGVALAAGLLVALLPQAVASSRFGRPDHHVAEALSMLLLAGWSLREPSTRRGGALRFEAAGAAAAAFACWTFTGGPLYVALAAGLLALRAVRSARPALLGSGAPGLLAGGAAAALLAVPALRQHGRALSFQLPSLLQPALVAVAAGAVALAVAAARRLPRSGAAARVAALAVGVAASATALALLWPAAARELAEGLRGWLLRRDPWLATIDEFQPLFGQGRGPVAALDYFFGAPGIAAPALLAGGAAWAARRTGERGVRLATLSAALFGLTLLQSRFGRVFAPFLAVAAALSLEGLAAVAVRALRRPRALRLLAPITAAAALLALADPRLRAMLRPGAERPLSAEVAAALELRHGPGDSPGDAPGVLAPWSFGHTVSYLADRPVVVNGFGSYLDAATFREVQRLATMDPEAVDRWMAHRRVGFLLAGAADVAALGGAAAFAAAPGGMVLAPASMRALPMTALAIAGSGIPDAGVPHLPHLMPRFASAQPVNGFAFRLPALWTYERVPGARVRGRAGAGARVVIEIPFLERGQPHLYRAWGDSGADGRFEIVVPLPTGFARATLRTAARAAARVGGGTPVPLEIPEEAVRRGGVVAAPTLAGAAGG